MRNKLFTLINVSGLSISIACCVMLYLYVSEQLSYDQMHDKGVYRVVTTMGQNEGMEMKLGSSSLPIGPAMKQDIPEVEESGRVLLPSLFIGETLIEFGDKKVSDKNGVIADKGILNLLYFEFISGNKEQAIEDPNSILLDRELAVKIFGSENPIGKMITLKSSIATLDFKVTAIIDNKQHRSHINPSYIIPMHNATWNGVTNSLNSWVGNNMAYTYVRLQQGVSPSVVEKKLNDLFLIHGKEELEAVGATKELFLQPVDDIHFNGNWEYNLEPITSMLYIRVVSAIGILVLILACVNYTNLSTAQAGRRSLEVGIRKVMGGNPGKLQRQFFGESFIIVLISSLLSVLLVEIFIPLFNTLTDITISLNSVNIGQLILFYSIFIILITVLAGIYPAIYLSSFKPIEVLKKKSSDRGGIGVTRKILVVFQFIISICLISGILIIDQQFRYIRNKEKGYNSESKFVLTLSSEDRKNYTSIKSELANLAGITDVSGTTNIPGETISSDMLLYSEGKSMKEAVYTQTNEVDYNWIQFMDIKLLSGRSFSENYQADLEGRRIIINQSLCNSLGFDKESIIGEKLFFDWEDKYHFEFEVIGVVSDFHQQSLHTEVAGFMFQLPQNHQFKNILVSMENDKSEETIASLKKFWTKSVPDSPFDGQYLDDKIIAQYNQDQATFKIIRTFAIISILISCLGLYALSVFIAERKFKEIGVRKAMGASIKDVLYMVTSGMMKLIFISFVLSIPISYYGSKQWLNTFIYKVEPSLLNYVWAGLISLIIGWVTIGYQSYKAARTNPVNVLKDE